MTHLDKDAFIFDKNEEDEKFTTVVHKNESFTLHGESISLKRQLVLDVGCNLVFYLAWIGVFLISTVLLVKTFRVYKVTLFKKNQTIRPRNILGPYILATILTVIVLITLTITVPIRYSTVIKIDIGSQNNQCYSLEALNIAGLVIQILVDIGKIFSPLI